MIPHTGVLHWDLPAKFHEASFGFDPGLSCWKV